MPTFTRTSPAPIVKGSYRAYRPHVQKDFRSTCAYCLIEELWAAGEANFELDHFKPKSLFRSLIKDFYNLYWSCHPCNHLKWDHWPDEELIKRGIAIVDLCRDDFEAHFLEKEDGTWEGLTPSAGYTIDALYLNRSHLKEIRMLRRQIKSAGRLSS